MMLSPALVADDPREHIIEVTNEAHEIHFSGLLFDGHNDLPWQLREVANSSFDVMDIAQHQPKLHTDIPRLRAGGLKAQFWSVYVPASTDVTGDALLQTMNQINIVKQLHRKYPDTFEMASTADDVERIVAAGKIASMMGIEGGHSIQGELGNLKRLYDEGCRYMTLTHSKSLSWADSATDDSRVNGLSDFGREVIQEMNRLGMLVDISHVSPDTMKQALSVSRSPVIFSHSSALAINDHPRNVPDDVLRLTAENGGVVMVNFYSEFVVPKEQVRKDKNVRGTIYDVVDHIEHIIRTAGVDHVGIGSDFDGVPRLPTQLDDVSSYPKITQELLNRGYRRDDIHKLMGGNIMRALRAAERVSKEMNTNVSGTTAH
ncbi:MAG: dipeptidase [Planctomyces sp.]|nr:dipeptidase [Planctomyces sp.]